MEKSSLTTSQAARTFNPPQHNSTKHTVFFRLLGISPYQKVLEQQKSWQKQRIEGIIEDQLVFVEHPPVLTIGKRGQREHIICSDEQLLRKGISVVHIDRGGSVTAHNPGQVVLYPIVNVNSLGLTVPQFVAGLEEVIIHSLTTLGIQAVRKDSYPGVWVKGRKIASIGLKFSHHVSMHGIAVNVANNLSLFDYCIPCGIKGCQMTSVNRELSLPITTNELIPSIIAAFEVLFKVKCSALP